MTKEYYNKNAKTFIDNTLSTNMKAHYQVFEKYLPKTGKIMDLGFGSGRDSLYFSKNYEVISIDNSEALVNEGKKILKNQVLFMDVKEMKFINEFDGIWACASLLHIPYNDLAVVLNKCQKALVKNGIMYLSFKYGDFEGFRKERYFTDLNEKRFNLLLNQTQFKLLELYLSEDQRPDMTQKWLNVIVEKG